MTYDGPYEEAVVCHSLTCSYLGRPKVQVHPVVLAGQCSYVKVAESVDLQLEGQGWLQVTVDCVFLKAVPGSECEVLGEGVLREKGRGR